MSKKIPLEDVFDGCCEYEGCRYNDDGGCCYDGSVADYLSYKKGNDFATCYGFDAKEGHCSECGAELISFTERHPYGDTFAEEEWLSCPNCG